MLYVLCIVQLIPAGSHGTANEYRLSDELVVNRNQRVVGRECTRRAFSMHQQIPLLTIQHVFHKTESRTALHKHIQACQYYTHTHTHTLNTEIDIKMPLAFQTIVKINLLVHG